jgi:unspecific monooxygenase
MPETRQPLVPPSPPRASETMTALKRMALIRESMIATWAQPAYEEDVIQGRFLGRSSFIINNPDAIRHVLVDNYENYTRTPAGIRVLRPVLGEGLLDRRGPRLEISTQNTGAGFHTARGGADDSAYDRGDG